MIYVKEDRFGCNIMLFGLQRPAAPLYILSHVKMDAVHRPSTLIFLRLANSGEGGLIGSMCT